MSHSVEQHLAVAPEAYDREILRFIPGYDAMLDELVDALAAHAPAEAPLRVLDVGAGTGALSARVAARLPEAAITMLDVDAAMLAQAEQRLAPHRDRVTLQRGSFFDALPACDAAVAALALHHVRDLDQKREIYRNIHHALAAGGIFLDADAAIPRSHALQKRLWARWAEHLVAHGDTEEQAYARFADWAKEDLYFSIDEEIAALKESGFACVEVLYRRGPIRVLAAMAPDAPA
jgi:tRNA (cmo5U34)-methyltransferase